MHRSKPFNIYLEIEDQDYYLNGNYIYQPMTMMNEGLFDWNVTHAFHENGKDLSDKELNDLLRENETYIGDKILFEMEGI